MERLPTCEIVRLTSLGLLAIALVGCVPSNTEAYTTPFGIVYNVENPDEKLIAHEEAHWKRSQEEGFEFWFNYTFDPNYRCTEEIRANMVAGYEDATDHPYCK